MKSIVITGMIGCGNSTIAELLAKKLNLKCFSLGKYYKNKGEGDKETDRNLNFIKTKEGRNKKFHRSLDNMQVELAKKGDIVIDSKLGIYFLKDYAKTIWLTASEEVRAERIAKREKWGFEESLKKLREKEKLERELFQKIYNIDYLRQKDKADIIVSTDNKTPNEIVKEIIERLEL